MFKKQRLLGTVLVLVAGIMWGSMGLFINRFHELGIGDLEISFLRSVTTAAVVWTVTAIVRPRLLKVKFKDLWCFVGTGVVSILLFNLCYFSAVSRSGMAVAATLLYTSPVFVMLMSLFFFKEKITKWKILAVVLDLVGCTLVSGLITGVDVLTPVAILLGIGAGFFYALYSIFGRFALEKGYSSLTVTAYTFLFAALGSAVFVDYRKLGGIFIDGGWQFGGYVLIYAVLTTLLPYLLYTFALQRLETSKAAVLSSIEPVAATFYQIIIVGVVPSLPVFAGVLLVLSAVAVLSIPPKKKEEIPE